MQWKKASEPPTKFGMYICKVEIMDEGMTFRPVAYCQYDNLKNEWTNPSVCYSKGEVVEWLDETIPSYTLKDLLDAWDAGYSKGNAEWGESEYSKADCEPDKPQYFKETHNIDIK
jgi:hypothetical protein